MIVSHIPVLDAIYIPTVDIIAAGAHGVENLAPFTLGANAMIKSKNPLWIYYYSLRNRWIRPKAGKSNTSIPSMSWCFAEEFPGF